MSILKIPKPYIPGIKILLGLSSEDAFKLEQSINEIPPCLTISNVCKHLRGKLLEIDGDSDLTTENLERVVDFLLSANDLKITSGLSVEEIVAGISDSFISENTVEIEVENVRSRLSQFLSSESQISLVSKIRSVYLEHEMVFDSCRVLTDVRPVFNDDISEIPAALIVHNLKINYLNADKSMSFFVALDDSDVDSLIADLTRAKRKALLIKKSLDESSLKFIEQNEGEIV
jgi:hypothetical protein